jgi:hypothetical protein
MFDPLPLHLEQCGNFGHLHRKLDKQLYGQLHRQLDRRLSGQLNRQLFGRLDRQLHQQLKVEYENSK